MLLYTRRSDAAAQKAGISAAAAAGGGSSGSQQQAGSRQVQAGATSGGASGSGGKAPKVGVDRCSCEPVLASLLWLRGGTPPAAQHTLWNTHAPELWDAGVQPFAPSPTAQSETPCAAVSSVTDPFSCHDHQVGIIMGSDSDLPTMKAAEEILQEFGVPCELTIVSAHRTPERMMTYACTAHERGLQVV